MRIRFSDIYRATLPFHSGNEGWIGLEPRGLEYHVVVPVDAQIAKGVMACNLPTDGTPFGGYSGWIYFRCITYVQNEGDNEEGRRLAAALQNTEALIDFASSRGIALVIEPADSLILNSGKLPTDSATQQDDPARRSGVASCIQSPRAGSRLIRCKGCQRTWETIGKLLADSGARIYRYRADIDDFRRGSYVFGHACGSDVEVPVRWFGRSRLSGKSLAGSHACPGLCYYEHSLSECNAVCEGSVFRRLASRLSAGT
jgi:hypothetical protein